MSIVSIVLLVAALALVASTGSSADETPGRSGDDRGWMMTDDIERPTMDEQMRERHGKMTGDEQGRERPRDMHGPDERPGPIHDGAARERMRDDCDHGDGPERTRQRANPSRMPAS